MNLKNEKKNCLFRQIVSEALQQVSKLKKKVLREKEKEKFLAKDRVLVRIKEEESNDSTSGIDGTDSDTLSNINVKIVIGEKYFEAITLLISSHTSLCFYRLFFNLIFCVCAVYEY